MYQTNLPYEIVVVAYRSRRQLEALLESLPGRIPVILVDNSADLEDVSDLVQARPNITYLNSGGNLGFAAAANIGAKNSVRPYLLFLNPDAQPPAQVLDSLVTQLENDPSVTACGPLLVDGDGRGQIGAAGWEPTVARAIVHALGLHLLFPTRGIWMTPSDGRPVEVDWLSGACLAVRRQPFLDIGGFDADYFLYNTDMDLGRKLRAAGSRLVLRADLRVPHVGGGSSDVRNVTLWSLRGSEFAQYLKATKPPYGAWAIRLVLAAGFLLRAAVYFFGRRRHRAEEMVTYARSILDRSVRT